MQKGLSGSAGQSFLTGCCDLCPGYHIDHSAPNAAGVKAGAFAFLEFDYAIGEREKRIIFSNANILASSDRSSALAHDNLPYARGLAIGEFYSQPLTLAVAAQ